MTTCAHNVYSRYLGTEFDAEGVEWCIAGCRDCDATIKFPARQRLAQKFTEVRADYARGMSATEIAKKHNYKSRGYVVALLKRLGVTMRDRTTARLMAMANKVPKNFDPHAPVEDLNAHFALCSELKIAKP